MRNFRFSSNFHFFSRNLRIIFTRNFGILVKFSHFVCEIFAFFASERNAKMKRNGREKKSFAKRFLLFTGNPSERSLPTARIVPLVYFHSTYVERCCSKISFRSLNVGRSMEICRSNLPGRSRALSRTSALNQSLSLSIFIIVNLHHR